jgi:microcystin degradation protein MlrC
MEHGLTVDLGASAVLDVGGIAVVVTTHCGPANDPAFFAALGIDLAATRLLCVKAKNHFRAAFAERCAAIIDVDCPGPAMADVGTLRRLHDHNAAQSGRSVETNSTPVDANATKYPG